MQMAAIAKFNNIKGLRGQLCQKPICSRFLTRQLLRGVKSIFTLNFFEIRQLESIIVCTVGAVGAVDYIYI